MRGIRGDEDVDEAKRRSRTNPSTSSRQAALFRADWPIRRRENMTRFNWSKFAASLSNLCLFTKRNEGKLEMKLKLKLLP